MDIVGGDFENLMPNIRRLNEAGVNFTFYYSASLCTPARSALMTGMHIFKKIIIDDHKTTVY